MKRKIISLLLTAAMALPTLAVGRLPLGNWSMLLAQCATGAAVYVLLSALFRVESFRYILRELRSRLPGGRKKDI